MKFAKLVGIQESDEDVDYSALGKYINKPFTEVMMKKISLSDREKVYHLPRFRTCWDKFTQSFLYPFYGVYYSLKECIFAYLILEIVAYVVGLLFILPLALAIIYSFDEDLFDTVESYTTYISATPILSGITIIYVYDLIFLIFFNFSYKRMSNITEQRMKGNRSRFPLCYCIERGTKKNCCRFYFCLVLCEGFELVLRRFCIGFVLLIILPVTLVVVNLIPVLGTIAYIAVLFFFITLFLGTMSFDLGLMSRKFQLSSLEVLHFYFTHMIYLSGFGAGSLVIYLIPVVNIYHYFYSNIPATRLFCHIDYYENKLRKHDITRKKKQVKMLVDEIISNSEEEEGESEKKVITYEEIEYNSNISEKKEFDESGDLDGLDDDDDEEDDNDLDSEEKRLLQELPPIEDGNVD